MYIAIIADLIKSREIENREEVQIKLNSILDRLNVRFEANIAGKFIITIGDEFQGLLNNVEHLEVIIDTLKFELYPYKLRIGIGMGELSTLLTNEYAIGADGPVYHKSRFAVEALKSRSKQNSYGGNDIMFCHTRDEINTGQELINASFASCYYIENKWTDKQRNVVASVMLEKLSQIEISEQLEIDQSNVNRRLNAAGYYTYLQLKRSVYKHINTLWEAQGNVS